MSTGVVMLSDLENPVTGYRETGRKITERLNRHPLFAETPWKWEYRPLRYYDFSKEDIEQMRKLDPEYKPEEDIFEYEHVEIFRDAVKRSLEPDLIEIYRNLAVIHFDGDYGYMFAHKDIETDINHRRTTLAVFQALGAREGFYAPTGNYDLAVARCDADEVQDYEIIKRRVEKDFPLQRHSIFDMHYLDILDKRLHNRIHVTDDFRDLIQGRERRYLAGPVLAFHRPFRDMEQKAILLARYLNQNVDFEYYNSQTERWEPKQYVIDPQSKFVFIRRRHSKLDPSGGYRWPDFYITDDKGLDVFSIFPYAYRSRLAIPEMPAFLRKMDRRDPEVLDFLNRFRKKLWEEMRIFDAQEAVYLNFQHPAWHYGIVRQLLNTRETEIEDLQFEFMLWKQSMRDLYKRFFPAYLKRLCGFEATYFKMEDFLRVRKGKIDDSTVMIIDRFKDFK